MNSNGECSITIENHFIENNIKLEKFKKMNEDTFSKAEMEQLVAHIKGYANQTSNDNVQRKLIEEGPDYLTSLIHFMQELIDIPGSVTGFEKSGLILSLFDALQLDYLVPVTDLVVHKEYVDIADRHLFSILDNEHTDHLIIGVDQTFITALNHCTEWTLYPVTYHSQYPAYTTIQHKEPTMQLSALGLFKRILSYCNKSRIQFFFKDNNKKQHITIEKIKKLCQFSLTVHVDQIPKRELANIPCLIKYYIENQIRKQPTLQSVVIWLTRNKNMKKVEHDRLYNESMGVLMQIQQNMRLNHRILMLLQSKVDDHNYATYDLNDIHEHHCDLYSSNHKSRTIIDTMEEAWMNQALLFTFDDIKKPPKNYE